MSSSRIFIWLESTSTQKELQLPDNWHICPITHQPIRHPALSEDGHLYELKAIYDYAALASNQSSLRARGNRILPIIYNYPIKGFLDVILADSSERYEEYDIGNMIDKLNRLHASLSTETLNADKAAVKAREWFMGGLSIIFMLQFLGFLSYLMLSSPNRRHYSDAKVEDYLSLSIVQISFALSLGCLFLDAYIRKNNINEFGLLTVANYHLTSLFKKREPSEPQDNRQLLPRSMPSIYICD